jgi:hypothetical protein
MLERPAEVHLIRQTEAYLARVLGAALYIQPTSADRSLPFAISDQYGFFEGPIANQPCLFLVVRADAPAAPSALEKHLQIVKGQFPSRPVLLVLSKLDSRARTRLIDHHIAFVVPDAQLYAPMLAIDLRERLSRPTEIPKHLSPSAQLLVLAHLLHQDVQEELSSRLAGRLHSTAMSMSRAFAEVEALGLAAIAPAGIERRLTFKLHGRALWERARPYLRSPVRKRRGLPNLPHDFPGLLAGEAALSRMTMLAAPRARTYAIAARDLKSLSAEYKLYYSESVLEEDYVLETWSYDPHALAQGPIVDPFSLFLSINDKGDERVASAADELLERNLS